MIIGVPKEIKTNENRIALVPAGAELLVGAGHTVYVEQGAGLGSGFPDEAYAAAGARLAPTADEVSAKGDRCEGIAIWCGVLGTGRTTSTRLQT